MPFSLPVALRALLKVASNLAILKVHLCIEKPLCCFESVRKGPLGQGEHPLGAGELTSTRHYRGELKDVDGRRSTARSGGLLRAIGCLKEVGGNEGKKRGRGRQRQTRNS